jgi:hypothetical protein
MARPFGTFVRGWLAIKSVQWQLWRGTRDAKGDGWESSLGTGHRSLICVLSTVLRSAQGVVWLGWDHIVHVVLMSC